MSDGERHPSADCQIGPKMVTDLLQLRGQEQHDAEGEGKGVPALPSHAVGITTLLYALTTIGSGVPLLVLAAAVVGLVTALQRRVTGGILGPLITHVTWSTGMLLLLPPVLNLLR